MNAAEGLGVVGANGEEGDFGGEPLADLLEAIEVGGVAGVVDGASAGLEQEAAVAAVAVAQDSGAPVLAGGEGDAEGAASEGLPPFEFDDAVEAEAAGEVSDAPGHDGDARREESAERWLMEVIEVGVGEQDQVCLRQITDAQAGVFLALHEEEPIGEVGVDQEVRVRPLDEEGGVSDPGDPDLSAGEAGEGGLAALALSSGEERLPDHLTEVRPRAEGGGWGEFLKRARQAPPGSVWRRGGGGCGFHGAGGSALRGGLRAGSEAAPR